MVVYALTMSLLFVILMGVLCSSNAHTFYVGGEDGWSLHPSEKYSEWATKYRFEINDKLVFKYKKGHDSVLVVNKNDYTKCNKENPIKALKNGDSKFKLEKSGPFFFISGHEQNCEKGQKLNIIVLSPKHHQHINITIAPSHPTHAPSVHSPASKTPARVSSVKPPSYSPSPSPAAKTPTHAPSVMPPSHSPAKTHVHAPDVKAPSLYPSAKTPGYKSPVEPPSHSPSPSPADKTPTHAPTVVPPSHSPAKTPTERHSHYPSPSRAVKTPTPAPPYHAPSPSPVPRGHSPSPYAESPKNNYDAAQKLHHISLPPVAYSPVFPHHHAPAPAPSAASDLRFSFPQLALLGLGAIIIFG